MWGIKYVVPLIKAGCIFEKMTPEMIAKHGKFQAILCVNPEKSGTILIAAQNEDYLVAETDDEFMKINELINNLIDIYGNDHDAFSLAWKEKNIDTLFENADNGLVERNPYIVWYRIYP